MTLSPSEREEFVKEAARLFVEELKKEVDLTDMIALPLDAVGAITGLGPKQVSRRMKTRAIGQRKLGVSLKEILAYQKGESA